jgi:hypothetical protein
VRPSKTLGGLPAISMGGPIERSTGKADIQGRDDLLALFSPQILDGPSVCGAGDRLRSPIAFVRLRSGASFPHARIVMKVSAVIGVDPD